MSVLPWLPPINMDCTLQKQFRPSLAVAELIGGLRERVSEGFLCGVPMLKTVDPALVESVISIMGVPGAAGTVGLLGSPFGQGSILAVTGAMQRTGLFEIMDKGKPFGGGFGRRTGR